MIHSLNRPIKDKHKLILDKNYLKNCICKIIENICKIILAHRKFLPSSVLLITDLGTRDIVPSFHLISTCPAATVTTVPYAFSVCAENLSSGGT